MPEKTQRESDSGNLHTGTSCVLVFVLATSLSICPSWVRLPLHSYLLVPLRLCLPLSVSVMLDDLIKM